MSLGDGAWSQAYRRRDPPRRRPETEAESGIAGSRLRDAAVVQQFAELVPLGRIAEVGEIKGLALLLASDYGDSALN